MESTSRKKLAQRIIREARQRIVSSPDEETISAVLGQQGVTLELDAKTLSELTNQAQTSARQLRQALSSLVQLGFVERGRRLRCPICGILAFTPLHELTDTIKCRSCRAEYWLRVLDENGDGEAPQAYRLDGLAARIADQDLLPPLLGFHALRRHSPGLGSRNALWFGLELGGDGRWPHEVDLLTSDGQQVLVGEAKTRAERFTPDEAQKLLDVAARLHARPVAIALEGTFPSATLEMLHEANSVILDRTNLLPSGPLPETREVT